MSVELVTLLFFGSLLFFLFIGTPLVFTLGGISVVFLFFTMGSVGFYIVASKFWDSMTSFTPSRTSWRASATTLSTVRLRWRPRICGMMQNVHG